MLMAAMGKGVGGNQTGFRLLDMRSYAQKNNLELIDNLNLQKETQNNWEHLKKLAENCSFRSGRNDTLRQGKKRVIGEHSYSSPRPSKKQLSSKMMPAYNTRGRSNIELKKKQAPKK